MKIKFKNSHIIYENEIRCNIRENEFNYSQNPTLQTGSLGDYKSFVDENFQPYITTVGLYNDSNELLCVAKLGQPLKLSSTTETCIIVRLDM